MIEVKNTNQDIGENNYKSITAQLEEELWENLEKLRQTKNIIEIRELIALNVVKISELIDLEQDSEKIETYKKIRNTWIKEHYELFFKIQEEKDLEIPASVLEEFHKNKRYLQSLEEKKQKNKNIIHYIPNEIMDLLKPFFDVWDEYIK
ncbi:MAG: hypothetical protein EAX96_06225 [Candidatus Lokiarchaeota archaeon]|nr:hypothetical protein [Candidatus Lokiarchaeota archaeon]